MCVHTSVFLVTISSLGLLTIKLQWTLDFIFHAFFQWIHTHFSGIEKQEQTPGRTLGRSFAVHSVNGSSIL